MTRVAAIHFSPYPEDNRPRRAAETLVEASMSVDVICLLRDGQSAEEVINGVRVHRIAINKERRGKLSYLLKYLAFLVLAGARLSILHLRERFDIVHIHNMPDILVLAALLPKLGGSRVVLDLHDPMPEMYMTKYFIGEHHPVIRALKFLEKLSIRFADLVITPNISFRNLFISRGCPAEKISIVMNSPMEKIFHASNDNLPNAKDDHSDRFVVMYHGSIFERHGLDTALEALELLRSRIPSIEFRVFGSGDYKEQFLKLVADRDLQDIVRYGGFVSCETISSEIRSIDVGVIPNKKSVFTEINMPTRIFEYLCLGKPTIVPRTQGILDYFDEESILFFEPENAGSLAQTIFDIYRNPLLAHQVVQRGIKVYEEHRWDLERRKLLELFVGLSAA